jgi:hypothetical protein
LYVLAQFSRRLITDRHRSAASDALSLSLASLRAAHGSTTGSESGAPSEVPTV